MYVQYCTCPVQQATAAYYIRHYLPPLQAGRFYTIVQSHAGDDYEGWACKSYATQMGGCDIIAREQRPEIM